MKIVAETENLRDAEYDGDGWVEKVNRKINE